MPLEQIRPLLSLETRSQGHFNQAVDNEGRTTSNTLGLSSPSSPRTPVDGEGLSSAASSSKVGPSSPSIRSNKILLSSPYDYPPHLAKSPDIPPSSSSSLLGFHRLSNIGAVTGSGNWKASGVSVIGRGHSSSSWDSDDLVEDTYIGTSIQTSIAGDEADGSRLRSRSKSSTSDSQSSHSMDVGLVSSFFKQSSLGDDIKTSRKSSRPPSPDFNPRDQIAPSASSIIQRQSFLTSSSSLLRSRSPLFDIFGATSWSSSSSGPGVGRVKSIGRGSNGSEYEEDIETLRRPSWSSALAAPGNSKHPSPSAHQSGSCEPAASNSYLSSTDIEFDHKVQRPVSQVPLVDFLSHPSPSFFDIHSLRQTSQVPLSDQVDSSLPPFNVALPPCLPTGAQSEPHPCIEYLPRHGSPFSALEVPGRSTSNNNVSEPEFLDRAPTESAGRSPSSASGWDTASTHLPRRHTAGYLRPRSALTQQTASFINATAAFSKGPKTVSTSFHGTGLQGGRKAARARARHPNLALLDNAPFSVLEVRRSEGMRQTAASIAGQVTQKDHQRIENKSIATGEAVSALERPLSPIARASPDAPRPLMSLGAAIAASSSAFSPTGSVSSSTSMLSDCHGCDLHAERQTSPSLVAAAVAASTAVDEAASHPPRPYLACQRSRPQIAGLDSSPATPTTLKANSSNADSMLRSPTLPIPFPASTPPPQGHSLSRSATTSYFSPPLSGQHAVSGGSTGLSASLTQVLGVPPTMMTHVLRTPTTEEWARYIFSQGLDPGRQMSRTRSATGRSPAGMAAQHRTAVANQSTERSPQSVNLSDTGAVSERLCGLNVINRTLPANGRSQSLLGSELSELDRFVDSEVDDKQALLGQGSVRSRNSSSSSDSSQARMEALHAAISMPPSRRGTPPPPPPSILDNPSPRSSSNSAARFKDVNLLAHDSGHEALRSATLGAQLGGAPPAADATLGHQIQELHGYVPAPPGHKRTVEDFLILRDIGRGAYGLVKLVRLKSPGSHEPTGPEFVVKYIIKSRILADCWRRHRTLGPIPVEIHVMDQLRRFPYLPPAEKPPWSPSRLWPSAALGDPYVRPESPTTSLSTGTPVIGCRESPARDMAGSGSNGVRPVTSSPSEVMMHQALSTQTHPALCTMLDFFEDESFYYLVMPRFGHGTDLFDYIESRPCGLQTNEARCILGQVADGVRFLHEHNIVHRDIKDENVILDGHGRAQLIDFGSAAHVRPGKSFDTFSGTLDYAAAEILRGDPYAGKEQDVWALGVVTYVCLVGDAPFWNGEEAMQGLDAASRAMAALEARCLPTPLPPQLADNEDASLSSKSLADDQKQLFEQRRRDLAGQSDGGGRLSDAKDLIERCLELDPTDRPSAADVCRHVFLAGYDPSSWSGHRGWHTGGERAESEDLGSGLEKAG